MKRFVPQASAHDGPEAKIQKELESYLKVRDWIVKSTHGNAYQSGFPDLYATHAKFGPRWIEVKHGHAFSFTPAQIKDFPMMSANGTCIWILCEAEAHEYERLFKPHNWYEYFVAYQSGCNNIYKWRGGKLGPKAL